MPSVVNATFFAESVMAKQQSVTKETGRPRAIYVTPEQFEVMSTALKDAASHLADVAKFMRENKLPKMMMTAAKMMDEHLPAVQAFSRRSWAEVGPAATAYVLGRKTRIESSQEKYARRKSPKSSP